MITCDKCGTPGETVKLTTVRVLSEVSNGDATGELCPECLQGLAEAVSDAGIPLSLTTRTSTGLGAST